MKLKKIIKQIIPKQLRALITQSKALLYRVLTGKKKLNSRFQIIEIKSKKTHVFFGYYDLSPFNSKDEFLYLKTSGVGDAQICVNDLTAEHERVITTTKAWNWQQGSRLRWIPNSDEEIIFNDFKDNKYVSRIINIRTLEERMLKYPLYDISRDGCKGLSINFALLGDKRPAYGYTNYKYVPENEIGKNDGIYIVDIKNEKADLVVPFENIVKALGWQNPDYNSLYLNHLSFSHEGDKFLFFFLKKENNWHYAYLLTYDLNTREIKVLDKERKVSHYTWTDNGSIICTSVTNDIKNLDPLYTEYFMDGTKKILCKQHLNKDGHPTMIDKTRMMSDTYPQRGSFQHLFIIDTETSVIDQLATVFHIDITKRDGIEKRTDLHPRINFKKDIICFDMNKTGYRSLGLLKLK